jgi:hypothetical protein
MSDIALGFHTYLQSVDAVTDLVGDRGYPNVAEENPQTPFYVYEIASFDPTYTVGGNDFSQAMIQVDCFADDRDAAEELRAAILTAVSNYRGAMGAETVYGCTVQSKFDNYSPPIAGESLGWYVHTADLLISYRES